MTTVHRRVYSLGLTATALVPVAMMQPVYAQERVAQDSKDAPRTNYEDLIAKVPVDCVSKVMDEASKACPAGECQITVPNADLSPSDSCDARNWTCVWPTQRITKELDCPAGWTGTYTQDRLYELRNCGKDLIPTDDYNTLSANCIRTRREERVESCPTDVGGGGWSGAGVTYTREVAEQLGLDLTTASPSSGRESEWKVQSIDCRRTVVESTYKTCPVPNVPPLPSCLVRTVEGTPIQLSSSCGSTLPAEPRSHSSSRVIEYLSQELAVEKESEGPTTDHAACSTCTPETETRSASCPNGQSGSITEQRNKSCPTGTWSTWQQTASTCSTTTSPTTPGCTPQTQTRSVNCSTGQSGNITEQRSKSCPSGAWGAWQQTASTCTADPVCPSPYTKHPTGECSYLDKDTRTRPCPTGQTGTITEQSTVTVHYPGIREVWGNWAPTGQTCAAVCPAPYQKHASGECSYLDKETRTRPCPTGQTGAVTEQSTVTVHYPNIRDVWGNWQQTASTCKVTCPAPYQQKPSGECSYQTTTTRNKPCPAGQTGNITERSTVTVHYPDIHDVWGNWTPISNTCHVPSEWEPAPPSDMGEGDGDGSGGGGEAE